MEKTFSGQIFVFLRLRRQHPFLHKTKGPTRNPFSPTPPPLLRRASMSPPAEQFSGRQEEMAFRWCGGLQGLDVPPDSYRPRRHRHWPGPAPPPPGFWGVLLTHCPRHLKACLPLLSAVCGRAEELAPLLASGGRAQGSGNRRSQRYRDTDRDADMDANGDGGGHHGAQTEGGGKNRHKMCSAVQCSAVQCSAVQSI